MPLIDLYSLVTLHKVCITTTLAKYHISKKASHSRRHGLLARLVGFEYYLVLINIESDTKVRLIYNDEYIC